MHSSALALFLILFAGCDRGPAVSLPDQGPEDVVIRFYALVSEAGPTSVGEAYKLVAKESNISEPRFREVVKKYPPGLKVEVTKSVITGERAVVDIEYKVESFFDDEYTVHTSLPLTIDREASAWRVDFTGETDSQSKDTQVEGAGEETGTRGEAGGTEGEAGGTERGEAGGSAGGEAGGSEGEAGGTEGAGDAQR